MKRSTLKLRARGQITIPKEWLEQMGAHEGDVFVAMFEDGSNGRMILEFQPTTRVNFADGLQQYIIADLAANGHSPADIERLLPERKARLEEGYAKFLRETSKPDQYVRGKEWMKDLE